MPKARIAKTTKRRKVEKVRTILLSKSIYEDGRKEADALRKFLKEQGVFLVNVMSSPGAGKTTTLVSLIDRLSSRFKIGVMEADIDSDVDAVTVAEKTGCRAVQLHTGGMCHLDAAMTAEGLRELGTDGLDLVFLENVGNLVCPAEYDTGANLDMMILSVPEGDDKPLKYPLVFEKCRLILVNKTDTLPYFDFDLDRCKKNIGYRNSAAEIIPVSAKRGDHMDAVAEYFAKAVTEYKEGTCQNKTTK